MAPCSSPVPACGGPRDRGEAIAVVREAVERGITHIDTSDYYGPHTVNELIRAASHPYPKNLSVPLRARSRNRSPSSRSCGGKA